MNLRATNHDGVVTYDNYEWMDILAIRASMFEVSDLWMLVDRFNNLTSTRQTELTNFRQDLRDITDYATANEAAENFPNSPIWMV